MGIATTKTPVCHIVASAGDKELLRSGMLSDIKVKCGDKTWDLHRVILPFEKVDWVINFIYTGHVHRDVLNLLEDEETVMNTCLELFTLANFFSLDGLRQRVVEVLTEVFIDQASNIQKGVRSRDPDEYYDFKEFSPRFLATVRTVYGAANPADMKPLKDTFLLFLRLTNYIALRHELLGKTLRTDPTLADFLTDILKATLFKPLTLCNEWLQDNCSSCNCDIETAVVFTPQESWCRNCSPLGEENVMKLLSDDWPFTSSGSDACADYCGNDADCLEACYETAEQGQCNAVGCSENKRATFTCASDETCFCYTDGSLLCLNAETGEYTDDVGGHGNAGTGVYTSPDGSVTTNLGDSAAATTPGAATATDASQGTRSTSAASPTATTSRGTSSGTATTVSSPTGTSGAEGRHVEAWAIGASGLFVAFIRNIISPMANIEPTDINLGDMSQSGPTPRAVLSPTCRIQIGSKHPADPISSIFIYISYRAQTPLASH
ncbi:hypothetical protein GGR58DRAFT_508407 [Xylaria digitata]|nr:hypothetical protein GGR58DRAFT_508407 [Xylaria digitata]